MPRRPLLFCLLLLFSILLLVACSGHDQGYSLPALHPPEADLGRNRPTCTDCHEERGGPLAFADFNHTAYFAESHRNAAGRNVQVCNMCHQPSFCNTCHATGIELKPSVMNQSDTYSRTPHRGDYLSRHRIDGKIDPGSCFRCHGNPKAARTCAPCHG